MNIRKAIWIPVIAAALLSCGLPVFAQPAAPAGWPPPKVLQIFREEIKPGKAPAAVSTFLQGLRQVAVQP